jgi:predicted choloylglycine hydrolase
MTVIECTPNKKVIREPIKINDELSIICTVNSFISENMKHYEWCGEDDYKSLERYNNVINAFKNYNNEDIIEYIKDVLKGNKGFMCQYEKSLNFKTV